MINFALKNGRMSDTETKALALFAAKKQTIKLNYFNHANKVPEGYIAAGDIDWVIDILGFIPRPDHYPEFLQHLLYRKIWKEEKWPMIKGLFIKPADKPKRFSARITNGSYRGKKKGPYWCSEKVKFINEWRYYIINGKVEYVGWYLGDNEDMESPELKADIPTNWCGCIDMGYLSTGEFALVEAGAPYAIGWYGGFDNCEIYTNFLIEGWKYLQTINGH